jgi:hypothetical protein
VEVLDLWEDVLPRLNASISAGLNMAKVAEFCNVSQETVRRWTENEHPAKGERLIRLWHLLALVGNESPELETLKPLQRFVSELFAFDVITASQACELLNLKQDKPSYMYHILRGSEVLNPQYDYEGLVARFGNELNDMKQLIREHLDDNVEAEKAVRLPEPVIVQPDVPAIAPSTDVVFHGDASVLLASLVSAIRPVADALLDDDTALEARNRFRELVSDETLFEVTNKLNALSSERARKTR